MLAWFYLYLKDKIDIIEAQLSSNFANHSAGTGSSIFYIRNIWLNFLLIFLEIISDLVKFAIILFADTSNGFNVIFKQRELKSCPYSYSSYKVVQAKVKLFSFASFSTIVAATTIVSLITNLMFGGRLPTQAATYGWAQTSWSGVASTTAMAIHASDQIGWDKYEGKDSNLSVTNSLTLVANGATSSITQTSETDFSEGADNGTATGGIGDGAYVFPCEFDHGGSDWEPTNNDYWDLDGTASTSIAGTHCNISNFTISSGNTVSVKAYDGTSYGVLRIYAVNSTITGILDASAKGYRPVALTNGEGPGGGGYGVAGTFGYGGAGGGYGGEGGYGTSGNNDASGTKGAGGYGSIVAPSDFGSAGGSTLNVAHVGGKGGGAIKLDIKENIDINGSVLATGGVGLFYGGAGAGGSIWISSNVISGSGVINASGASSGSRGGGGGGGRIAVSYNTKNFTGSFLAKGATSGYQSSGAGTIYEKSTSQSYGNLIIDNNNANGANTPIATTAQNVQYDAITVTKYGKLTNVINLTTENLIVNNNGTLTASGNVAVSNSINGFSSGTATLTSGTINTGTGSGGGTFSPPVGITDLTLNAFTIQTTGVTVSGTVIVGSGSNITHPQGNTAGLTITATNVEVQSGGNIDVTGKGYAGAAGSAGGGPCGGGYGSNSGGGGGHGGMGGAGHYTPATASGGCVNGSETSPITLGSAGGARIGMAGGNGGGRLYINISGVATLNGLLKADGIGGGSFGGGGAGGSIWVVAGSIIGSGQVKAEGGDTGSNTSGAGGGGRIAFTYVTNTFLGTLSAIGKPAGTYPESASQPGTKYGNGTPIAINGQQSQQFAMLDSRQNSNQDIKNRQNSILAKIFSFVFGIKKAQAATADFTSDSINTGYLTIYASTTFTTINFSADSGIKFQIASNNDNATWNFVGPNNNSDAYYATSGQAITSEHTNKSYIRYKVFFTFANNEPRFSDITFNYNVGIYATNQSLTSSWYNTQDPLVFLAKAMWEENISTNTAVRLQMQTAPDDGFNQPNTSSATGFFGPGDSNASYFTSSTTECTKNNQVVSCQLDSSSALGDGQDDQWIQYKIFLDSDTGVFAPTVDSITLQYAANATPEVAITNIPVTQSSADGKIIVDYQVRDTDTNTGRTPGYVNLTLEYCTANCMATGSESWSVASEAALAGNFGASTTVDLVSTSTWTNHSLVWDPNIDFEGQYIPAEFKLRLVANDSEGANNLGRSESNPLLLDTANPLVGSSGVLAKVDATANPALVTMDATDDTTLYMKVGLNPDLSDAPSWLPYASTTAITLTTDPDTVYVQFKDEYNNLTDISPVTPETPINMVIRDLTNSDVGSFMEFIAWKVVTTPGPGFKQYNIWRGEGTDTVPPESYALLATIGSSSKNYHLDTGVSAGTTYYYKISSEDSNGNQSYFSQVVKDAPDGQGGTDNTPPTIKGVEVVTTSTQSATIEWDTDELSDSLVGYSLAESDFSDMLGIDTMANYSTSTATSHGYDPQAANGRHRVTLSGLTPGTTYYFKVKSTDPQGNYAEDTNGGPGFSFTTKPGPRMQFGPIVTSINNRQAVINWQTDILANATVVYATNTDFTDSKTASTTDFLIDQQVTVADLQAETKYYFYIKNQDELGNESIIKKVENGIESYYDFTTTNDANPPLIEEVTCSILSDTSLSIKWKTTAAGSGKPATARVDYGSQSGSYASSTETAMEYNADHTVELSDLLASSTYYFQVVSTDLNGNTATSSEYSCGTSEELVPKTEADKLIQEAKATGKSEGLASAPGGGIMTIDKTDKTAPIISDIRITDLTATSARVSWVTNEETGGLIKYGLTSSYGESEGDDILVINHEAKIKNLEPNNEYNYLISSADAFGNISRSNNLTFQTPALSAEEALALSTSTVPGTKEDRETLMKSIAEKAISIITSMANQVSLGSLENTLLSQYNAIEKLAQIIPAPVLSGEPAIDTTPTTATIRWNTDKPSNSLIAFVPEAVYAGARGDAAYSQVVGDALAQVTKHEVKLYNLKPEVVYHYQLRSKAPLGPLATSRDFSFKTKPEALEITSYTVDTLSPQKTTFRWLTSSQTDTQLRITPFRGNMLAVEEAKTYIDKTPTTNHEQLIDQLESGTVYQVTLFGIDQKGIRVEKVIPTFSTTKDDLPPTIDNIQTESALSQGKDLKVQTAISWTTNEPTACSLKYAKGSTQVETDLTEETMPEASYSRKHALVITKFELGSVYSFRIYCTDSGDNQTISEPHAILTPKQRDSVFDLIINTMEQTFGWIGKLKG